MIADEAYIDFADPALRADRARDVLDGRPVIVIRSFSKIFGLAGLRLGFAISDPGGRAAARPRAGAVQRQSAPRSPPGIAAVADPGFVERRRAEVAAAREAAGRAARRRPASTVHPSQSNFVLVELGVDDVAVCEALMRRGILVRGGSEFGLPGHRPRHRRARSR